MSDSEARFNKARVETLCDGIFCVAMTLLALELKAPDLPKHSEPAAIWHALAGHPLPFLGFALTFILAGASWLMHHRLFQHIRGVSRAMVLLTIPFLMFVSLLPFSTSMLTAFGTRNPVALTFYIGNQLALSSLLAVQWLLAQHANLLTGHEGDADQRNMGRVLLAQPAGFLVALGVAWVSPQNAMTAIAVSLALFMGLARRADRPNAARVPPSSPGR